MTKAIRRALVSVYDKTGLDELARGLHEAGVEIVSTGSTAARIASLGIPVTQVQDVTGFAEALDGRVKTLHPGIHAGILADLRKPEHRDQLDQLGIKPFDLVVVNLYPFASTVASGANFDECVEQIDIGGPAMVRASAKNHANVAIVVSPSRYDAVIQASGESGFSDSQRLELARDAFRHVAQYDLEVATWLGEAATDEDFPGWLGQVWERAEVLRYGENPHQEAALYINPRAVGGVAQAEQIHGKEMSFNNYVDADHAHRAVYDFDVPAVAIIKHANPCGIAIDADIHGAYLKAHATDPVSAFGGVIAANRAVTADMARAISDVFTEVLVAPAFDTEAIEILRAKANLRLLIARPGHAPGKELRQVGGGLLVQTPDRFQSSGDIDWTLVAGPEVGEETLNDLKFAWRACRGVKSNAILLARDGAAVGIGMGQVNRVDSARLAVARAGKERAEGSVAASDAFFPFADGLQVLIDAGIRAVVHPGGSVRDDEVVAAAQAAGISLYVTGTRHFAH